MATKMTNYELLSQTEWRVSFTEEAPDTQIDRLYEEVTKELPRYNTPVTPSIIDVTTPEGTEKRLLIKHQNSPYDTLHILIGLRDFGTFVYASQWNCLVKEPERPSEKLKELPSPTGCWPIILGFIGIYITLVGLADFGEGGWIFFLVGLGVVGSVVLYYKDEAKKKNAVKEWNESVQAKRDKWIPFWVDYWNNIQKAFLSDFDNTLFRLQDSTGVIMEIVLKRMFPQAEGVSKEEQSTNNREEIRKRMKADLEKHQGKADMVKKMFR